jgi:hypothetical protein
MNPVQPHALPARDPIDFVEKCLKHYDEQDIRGYRAVFQKQEYIDGRLQPPEVIEVAFRAQPYSVFMHWAKGARRAATVLYIEGQNDGKMLVHPTGLVGVIRPVVALDPEGPQAREAGRYSIKEFGLRRTLERTLKDWKAARASGTARVEYVGVENVPAAGDRSCYVLRATFHQPHKDGIAQTTVLIDQETWFQVGTVLRGREDALLGDYLYPDIQINPPFQPDPFTPAALTR